VTLPSYRSNDTPGKRRLLGGLRDDRASAQSRRRRRDLELDDEERQAGVDVLAEAITEPIRKIAENAGEDGPLVMREVLDGDANYGFNAQTREYEDLVVGKPCVVRRTSYYSNTSPTVATSSSPATGLRRYVQSSDAPSRSTTRSGA